MKLHIAADIKSTIQRLSNFSIQANITGGYYDEPLNKGNWNDTIRGIVERKPQSKYNSPDWSYDYNTGVRNDFKRHDGINDQEKYRRQSMGYVKRQGTLVKYYSTSFEPYSNPLYKEDTNRTIERVFT